MNRLAIALALVLSGCASSPSTPYRAPQVTISGNATEQAKMTIVQSCVTGGGSVEQNTPNQLVCSKPMDGSFGALMYRAMLTPAYSTNPDLKARYAFVNTGSQTFITIDTYIEHQNAYGQITHSPVQNNQLAAKAQAMLDAIKTQIEGGAASVTPAATTPAEPECKACQKMGG
jgi:PBP1b-binding outer membrane lipoprotein LpoB